MLGRSKSERLLDRSSSKDKMRKGLGIKISLGTGSLVSQKVFEQREKRREELERKGLRDPWRERVGKGHDVLVNVESEFL